MRPHTFLIATLAICCYLPGSTPVQAAPLASIGSQDKKVMMEFRGVRLGAKKDAVQAALGKPANSDDSRAEFNLEGGNQVTVHYENGEVKAIQISFESADKAPTWHEVVGDAEVSQMESGAKMARKVVAAEHFWVSMYQSKDGTTTRITISR